ncbi:MAG: ABC transporter substrate-binding protein, partial [Proteobacteria bacterium]|nr:ABC transporter substrate-binding protein [Pseudomonadota bacterium]
MNSKKTYSLVVLSLLFCVLITGLAFAKNPILVGCPLPLTGPYASDGEQMKMALELAVEEKNASGGLLGHPVKLKFGDVGGLEAEKIKAKIG